jgi:hypothetical protein
LPKENLGALERETTDLVSDNVRAERMFKLEVMDWLNDGNPKLFRSPTEGNYVVRLLNVSLSPNTTVGRMLHQFSSMAYEISDTSFTSLETLGLFTVPNLETMIMRFKTIKLNDVALPQWVTNARASYLNNPPPISEINSHNSNALAGLPIGYLGIFEGVTPDTIFGLRFENTSGENLIEYIRIGETQIYQINAGNNKLAAIYPIWTPNIKKTKAADRKFDGTFTLGYYTTAVTDNFSQISNFDVEDRMTQFFGLHDNIIEELEDIRTSVGKLYWLKFQTRDIKDIYIDKEDEESNNYGKIYSDAYNQVGLTWSEILPTSVYADNSVSPVRYYSGKDILDGNTTYLVGDVLYAKIPATMIDNTSYYWTEETYDNWGSSGTPVNRLYKFSINHVDNNIDLETIGRYIITNLDNVTSISIGRMIMVDCYYQLVSKSYSIEDEDPDLEEVKRAWIT